VRLALDEGKSIGSVARDLSLTETAMREWVNRAGADRTKGKTGLTTAEREEFARLRRENGILQNRRARNPKERVSGPGAARLVGQKLRGVRSHARGRGRSLSGDIVSPLKNMVRGWPAHMSVVTPHGDPV
jgi:transposase